MNLYPNPKQLQMYLNNKAGYYITKSDEKLLSLLLRCFMLHESANIKSGVNLKSR